MYLHSTYPGSCDAQSQMRDRSRGLEYARATAADSSVHVSAHYLPARQFRLPDCQRWLVSEPFSVLLHKLAHTKAIGISQPGPPRMALEGKRSLQRLLPLYQSAGENWPFV